jgi:hypothetical protein
VAGGRLLRPERANHVWAYDVVEDRTRDGRKLRMLCVVDEFTREAPAIRVARKRTSSDVIDVLAELVLARGTPAHIRSDQGPESIAEAVKAWIAGVGPKTAHVEKTSPWENGYVASFNGKIRDELLNGEVFNTLREAQVLIEEWRRHTNRVRPHSALAPEALANAEGGKAVAIPGPQISSGPGTAAMAHRDSTWITRRGLVTDRTNSTICRQNSGGYGTPNFGISDTSASSLGAPTEADQVRLQSHAQVSSRRLAVEVACVGCAH